MGRNEEFSSTCCWREESSRQRNKGWFLRPSGSVSWSGSAAQVASDLCVGASSPILLFFIGGGVALHERLVGRAARSQCACSNGWPGHDQAVRHPRNLCRLARFSHDLTEPGLAWRSFFSDTFAAPRGALWPFSLAFPRSSSSSALFALHPSGSATSHDHGFLFCTPFAHLISVELFYNLVAQFVGLAILSKMAQKPEVQFDKLFQKLYNIELWLLAYQSIAPKPGNMTVGVDGKTIDGAGLKLITDLIADLKASRYTPRPTRRVYIPKANGKVRPLGIPSFQEKLLMTVAKLILEAIYEPTFSDMSHGFRPERSCHTALEQVKTNMVGTRWWVEGDIKGLFDHVNHETLLRILSKRITDHRFLHLIGQLLKAGYVEDWRYNRTYSGVPQGGNLSPLLANIYLNELDEAIASKRATFNTGKARKRSKEYHRVNVRAANAKKRARQTGEWKQYKALRKQMLSTPSVDHQDSDYKRLFYVRYADDFLLGVIGSKAEAIEWKAWLEQYLQEELQLELSVEKTLITHATQRVRFLGYDITRWKGKRVYRFPIQHRTITRRTGSYQLRLLMPRDKTIAFAKEYGDTTNWRGTHRTHLLGLSE